MAKIVWCALVLLALTGCDAVDETAETACANAKCPPGTKIEMNAQSSGSCNVDMEFSADQGLTDQSASGAASEACYTSGSCVYACTTTTECCGSETWTEESYTCSQVCSGACGNGECEPGEDADECPADCEAHCGDGECEYGEYCLEAMCQGEEVCEVCGGDCCPQCGDDVCEFPEDGQQHPDKACPQDCGTGSCAAQCPAVWKHLCPGDGCSGTCACTPDRTCEAGVCVPISETPEPPETGKECTNSLMCSSEAPTEHCVAGVCEPCPSKCATSPCDDGDCAGCGQCGQGKLCKDNGDCFAPAE